MEAMTKEEFSEEFSKASKNLTDMLGQEVVALKKIITEHQESDDKIFQELHQGVEDTQLKHDKVIALLEKNAINQTNMQLSIDLLSEKYTNHENLIQQGKGALWITGFLVGLGTFVAAVKEIFFGKK